MLTHQRLTGPECLSIELVKARYTPIICLLHSFIHFHFSFAVVFSFEDVSFKTVTVEDNPFGTLLLEPWTENAGVLWSHAEGIDAR